MSIVPWLIAIPVTAIVMGGWRRLIPLIFRKRTRDLSARMLNLTNSARLEVYSAVLADRGSDLEAHRSMAAAITNYLFGETARPEHISRLYMPAIEHEAMTWLDTNPDYCELIVESLKIQMLAKDGLGESGDHFNTLLQTPVFLKYGDKFQTMPDPKSYLISPNPQP